MNDPSTKKRVLYVHHGTGMGGAPQLLLRFMQHLDAARYEPIVWCIRRSSASDLFEQHGFKVIYEPDVIPFLHISDGFYGLRQPHRVLKMLYGQLRSYRAARRVFAQVKPDLIHINSVVIPGVLGAAAKVGCPVMVNVLECLHPGYTGLRRMLLRNFTRKRGDAFVFMLPSEARRWGLLDKDTTVAVFDFIDLDRFAEPVSDDLRREYQMPPNTALLGYFGRFTNAKGVHVLVRALGILKRHGVKFKMLLVGPVPSVPPRTLTTRIRQLVFGQPYIERLRAVIAKERVQDMVSFVGERLEVERLVAQCDILVAPFIEPHFSRLCAEAAAAGRPAVAFNIDGPGEEIVEGETGLLARPFDAEDLARKLEDVIARPELRRAMGEKGRVRATAVFDARKNVDAVMALYRHHGIT